MRRMTWLIFIVISMVGLFMVNEVKAVEENDTYSFSVTPLKPGTKDPQESYYELKVQPNEQKNLEVRVQNSSNHDLTVDVETNNGSTNDNGISSYLKKKERDSSLLIGFSDLAKAESDQVTIPANSYKDVAIHLTIPETPFEGTVLGGLRFTSHDSQAEVQKKKSDVGNNIAYTIGVVLQESDEEVAPLIQLNTIQTEQRNGRNYISGNIQNKAPRIIKNLTVDAKVYEENGDKVLYEASNNTMRMAPNSNFNFGISLETHTFKSGTYRMKLEGSADGEAFSFDKVFKIESKEAKKWNENAVWVEEDPANDLMLYAVIGVLTILLLLSFYYFFKSKRGMD